MSHHRPGLRVDMACGTGFLVETGLFCAYTCLFIAAFPVLTSARRLKDARSARSGWVFLIFTLLMYLVAAAHLILSGFRFYKSTYIDPNGPISYLGNPNHWEFLGVIILVCIQTWLGDILVIYRCYFVWENNLWVISVPVLLLLGTIGINLCVLYWFRHPFAIAPAPAIGLLRAIYPLAFVQNFMTTSFIILRIFLQHQASKKAGIVHLGSKLGLIRIMRIVIESAAIYTIQILVLNVLYFRDDNFQFVIQPAIIPSIGITFVLLALRIEASRYETTRNDLGIRSSKLPQWLREQSCEIGSKDSQNGNQLPAADGTAVTEQELAVEGESGAESNNWDSEFSSDSATRPKAATSSVASSKNSSACMSKLPV
ncbi:hypothetical protein D9619_004246 [Psilocybe cf. subviscida]|uniref:Uncharacterized protein n=1 Tax=Psilocybe cf. subviscida TaxID=2480587 RepID=A0A8H5BPR0_9AGAR|nr:hypothetical protein D9619_004246 [Psilocybe cf. subviscida]